MSDERPAHDLMNYQLLEQEARRGVVRAALKRAALATGLPGQHSLYITFKTRAAGVSTPQDLLERYPDMMTIVLQHQYWDLAPGETFFAVTLRFGGQPKRLSIPYSAITRFEDPSVAFLLEWPAPDVVEAEVIPAPIHQSAFSPLRPAAPTVTPEADADVGDGATPAVEAADEADPEHAPKIVSLDQFRKK